MNYSRSTDYETGEISVNWTDNRGDWERTAFVSRPDDVTVQRLISPDGEPFDCEIELGTAFPFEKIYTLEKFVQLSENIPLLNGLEIDYDEYNRK